MALDADLSGLGARTHLGDAIWVRIDGDCFRTRLGEGDRVVCIGYAQFDGAFPIAYVATQAQFSIGGDSGSIADVCDHGSSVAAAGDTGGDRDLSSVLMSFSVGAIKGTDGGARGIIDHRLARRMLIAEVKRGRLRQEAVCDAHPELIRAARNVGTATKTICPICEETELRLVTYVFGHGLQAQGHCVSTAEQMRRINARSTDANAYVVEACIVCRWNHLLRILPVGGR